MRGIALGIIIGCLLFGFREQWLALQHLTPQGAQHRWRILMITKMFEPRESFTEEGWLHWRRALWLSACALLIGGTLFLWAW